MALENGSPFVSLTARHVYGPKAPRFDDVEGVLGKDVGVNRLHWRSYG